MASVDKPEDNRAFAEKNAATFPILSDVDKSVSSQYGVLSGMGFAKRWTFYIDGEGTIARIDKDVNPRTAGADLVASLKEMGVPTANETRTPLIPDEPNSD
jgi:peroxiredoxin Q/BCP